MSDPVVPRKLREIGDRERHYGHEEFASWLDRAAEALEQTQASVQYWKNECETEKAMSSGYVESLEVVDVARLARLKQLWLDIREELSAVLHERTEPTQPTKEETKR